MNNYDMTEMNRALSNLIRVGNIRAVDAANALVRVAFGGCVSDWIPWGTSRAGNRRDWTMPNVGEQVMVFAPFGDPTQAVVGPSIFQDDFSAPATSPDKDVTVFPDGTTFEYDSATNTYTQTIAGSGNWVFNLKNAQINTETATVTAETSVTLDTPETTITGNLTVEKNLTMGGGSNTATFNGSVEFVGSSVTHNGKNIGATHQHSGVQTGGGNTGAPV